jgi:hypothetical protein
MIKRILLCLIPGVIAAVTSAMLAAAAEPAKDQYVPGLGEFMAATQVRHAKLWFAGKNANWPLAAWEVDEIREGLADATKYHATHDGIPVAEMIKTIIDPRLEKLDKAIAAKSGAQFTAAFDELSDGCNSCHAAANKPFIRIQRPTTPPFSNQDFTPAK